MAVELLLQRVRLLDYAAADPAGDPVAERERMIELLMRFRAVGLSAEQSKLLSELEFLQIHAAKVGAPMLLGLTEKGLRIYEPEHPSIATRYSAVLQSTDTRPMSCCLF